MSNYEITLDNSTKKERVKAAGFELNLSGGMTFYDKDHKPLAYFRSVQSVKILPE